MQIYRFITDVDTSRILPPRHQGADRSWTLHGSPTYAFDPVTQKMRCGQAVTKDVEGPYEGPEGRKLADYPLLGTTA